MPEGEPYSPGQYDEVEKEALEATNRKEKLYNEAWDEARAEDRYREKIKEEIGKNVEFWRSLGIEIDELDVRAKIEELPYEEMKDVIIGWGYEYLYMPKGIKASELLSKIKEDHLGIRVPNAEEIDNFTSPRTSEESYAVAHRLGENPDAGTFDFKFGGKYERRAKTAEDWEKTDYDFMTPLELLVADLRHRKKEGTHLNPHFNGRGFETMFPRCRGKREHRNVDRVPIYYFDYPEDTDRKDYQGSFILSDFLRPNELQENAGVRRVVAKK